MKAKIETGKFKTKMIHLFGGYTREDLESAISCRMAPYKVAAPQVNRLFDNLPKKPLFGESEKKNG